MLGEMGILPITRIWLIIALAFVAAVISGCGGGDEEVTTAAPTSPSTGTSASTATAVSGGTTAGAGVSETLQDTPFVLDQEQPVPPEFESAYQRGSLIVVEFYKQGDSPFYPQGLSADAAVDNYLGSLRAQYGEVEFFTYEISNHGSARTSDGLRPGQYGSLASQLGVGYTPFVAMLAPQEDGQYVIENLFQGYIPRPVLNQALFDLASNDTANASEVDVTLEQVDLTSDGGGIDFFTVRNNTRQSVNLQNFSLKVLDPQNAEVDPAAPGAEIPEELRIPPGQTVSVGRVPDLRADGQTVAGTFEGGQDLDLAPGDQVALLDADGAITSTFTV